MCDTAANSCDQFGAFSSSITATVQRMLPDANLPQLASAFPSAPTMVYVGLRYFLDVNPRAPENQTPYLMLVSSMVLWELLWILRARLL